MPYIILITVLLNGLINFSTNKNLTFTDDVVKVRSEVCMKKARTCCPTEKSNNNGTLDCRPP